jgi:large repetitive protein
MEITRNFKKFRTGGRAVMLLLLGLMLTALSFGNAQAYVFDVRDGETDTAFTGGYRWLVEEDVTWPVTPNNPATNWGTKFHKSYMPVVAKGCAGPLPDDPNFVCNEVPFTPVNGKRYYVSVVPFEDYSMGGGQLVGNGTATIYVQPNPIPTAQITVFVFEDNNPINNAPDLPEEQGLAGFKIKLEDAGGRYGASAGEAFHNAFGHPIGTIYNEGCDPYTIPPTDSTNPCIATWGEGFVLTDADGQAVIKNMAPGKYGVITIPPNAVEVPEGSNNWVSPEWQQTSTIEGTKLIDAWVKANEPPFFAEFGPPGWHVFVGFTREYNEIPPPTGGVFATITGKVVNNHLSRPPETAFYDGATPPHTTPWVGLNDAAGVGPALYVQRTGEDGTFTIPNVPPGDYQLVVFDDNLDLIFNFMGVSVTGQNACATPNGTCDLGNVPTFDWFTKIWAYVFNDNITENGIWDTGEAGMPEVPVNLRWRDGSLYQFFPTDGDGYAPFDEVFPFFSWLVAEVDFAQYKATGATIVVDAGGAINPADDWTFDGQLNPQDQDGTWGGTITPTRVETGPVLTQAFQGFLGQTSVIQFGKKAYGPGENGGISGVVYYSVTRAEDDPEWGAPEPWEPGIPRVRVNLYEVTSLNDDGTPNIGALVNTTFTDSWDDSLPTGCPGDPTDPFYNNAACYDGMRNWNQVRPGVFDGGYAFNSIYPDGVGPDGVGIGDPVSPIPLGRYVVEVIPPTGYEIVRSQDKNVDFGDEYVPSPELVPPKCVNWTDVDGDGLDGYTVPAELSLFPGVPAPKAGLQMPDCDQKLVQLSVNNTAADFFLFTEVPIAAHIKGFILDDTGNEFDPNSPQFGEKYAPPWMPVGIYDWAGRPVGETISDQWGVYNTLVPSTYTQNLPMPSGTSPNMLTTCMNDPNAPTYGQYFNPQYSTFCYTFQYMPGTTTYLDTPVVPVAAFAGPDQFPLDCELPSGTPKINSVSVPNNGVDGGPYMTRTASGNGRNVTITSVGTAQVPNPTYCPDIDQSCVDNDTVDNDKNIDRDYGFGTTPGTVQLVAANGTVHTLTVADGAWDDTTITATVPATVPTPPNNNAGYYQLVVTRDNGLSTVNGVTFQIGLRQGSTARNAADFDSIQAAVDAAGTNDLILVPPGTYDEFVIMWKPVQLQGWGAGSTIINAVKGFGGERLSTWRARVEELVTTGAVDLLPGQEEGFGGIEPITFFTEEGAGVLVVAKSNGNTRFDFNRNIGARVDGFTIRGADQGGAIVANGYTDYLEISNNVLKNNNGFFGGGFRSGHPQLDNDLVDSDNDNIRIHHNMITQNGGMGGAGGGVSLCTGTDGYQVTQNFICGNFALNDGGGIGHLGLSNGGRIADNEIRFNESFNQGLTVHGGGIFIGGGGAPVGQLSPGSGSVVIEANRILGNLAGAGDGGGIALLRVNGQDVAGNRNQDSSWYTLDIFDNLITNNVAALAGGGISLQDTVKANIIHNTVAHNDTTATASQAFTPGFPNFSNPQPAGIVSRAHSDLLDTALENAGRNVPDRLKEPFANPQLVNTIVWENRSFYFFGDPQGDPPLYELRPAPASAVYWDLAVLPVGTGFLSPTYSVLTSLDEVRYSVNATGDLATITIANQYVPGNNTDGDPAFIDQYFNGSRNPTIVLPEPLFVAAAFDEGGNFIQVRFGPLTLDGKNLDTLYHIGVGSALDAGTTDLLGGPFPALSNDFDGDLRPQGGAVDIGADEAL